MTTPDEHTEIAKAERQEKLSQLVLHRSELSADEAALPRECFSTIHAEHRELVWNLPRRERLTAHDIKEASLPSSAGWPMLDVSGVVWGNPPMFGPGARGPARSQGIS